MEYLEDQLARMEIMLSMYTLRFVKKSGRVSAAAAFAGELLGLRPIIHMVDDTTSTIAKVRGDSAVMPGLIVQTKKRMAEGTPYLIGATDDGNAKMLAMPRPQTRRDVPNNSITSISVISCTWLTSRATAMPKPRKNWLNNGRI